MSIIKRVTHPASLSFVNLILALGSVPTVALSSSTRKSRIMISVGICSCQCTIIPEWVINLGGITDQFARNKCSTSPVSLSTKNGIFMISSICEAVGFCPLYTFVLTVIIETPFLLSSKSCRNQTNSFFPYSTSKLQKYILFFYIIMKGGLFQER